MTTIMIIVVVALVFFAVAATSVFIVWKRETEMRTNSIRFIEDNLVGIRNGLEETATLYRRECIEQERRAEEANGWQKQTAGYGAAQSSLNSAPNVMTDEAKAHNTHSEDSSKRTDGEPAYAEISLDFADGYDDYEHKDEEIPPASIVGKSGKKYTISELEILIKE